MNIDLSALVRPNIRRLQPYASARSEFSGQAEVYLDANENPFASVGIEENYARYPDPLQKAVKEALSQQTGLRPTQIFLGNGSDEGIDLLMRIFCQPTQDKVLIMPPTYGMYQVCADINEVAVCRVPLRDDFQIDTERVLEVARQEVVKIIFICSPNNPTGNRMKPEAVLHILENFSGLVAIDEAYIDFCPEATFLPHLAKHNNLLIFRTFSKAWGLAGLRLGITFAHSDLISLYNRVKPPYNISAFAQQAALKALKALPAKEQLVQDILAARADLFAALQRFSPSVRVYPSDTNFVFAQVQGATEIYKNLLEQGIIVRNQAKVFENALRITVGTPQENTRLVQALSQWLTHLQV
ncbi:MAG: histidinol-phosphate transaminase [Microscillaceae bacterium]